MSALDTITILKREHRQMIEVLEELAGDPDSETLKGLAHRAARLVGCQCSIHCCASCEEERNDSAEERVHYGRAA